VLIEWYHHRLIVQYTITQTENILESISGEQHNNKMHMSSGLRFLTWQSVLAAAM